MKNRYLCTYIDCINLIYPKGYKLNNYKVAILNLDLEKLQSVDLYEENSDLNENEKLILDELINNKGKIKIDKFKKIKNINNILDKMKRKNIIDIKWEYKDHKKILLI